MNASQALAIETAHVLIWSMVLSVNVSLHLLAMTARNFHVTQNLVKTEQFVGTILVLTSRSMVLYVTVTKDTQV